MKKTDLKEAPKIETFRGEFSGQWVGIMRVSGDVVHSVQRPTQAQAATAVADKTQPRFA